MASLLSAPPEPISQSLRLLVVAEPHAALPALNELIRRGRVNVEIVSTCAQAADPSLQARLPWYAFLQAPTAVAAEQR